MKKLITLLAALTSLSFASASAHAAEAWKGVPSDKEFSAGAMAGLGVIDATAGFSLLGTVAKKIVKQGFVPDLNDSVWVEFEGGPFFAKGSVAFAYSAHLRWDFVKDDDWTFYAVGGLGGNVTGKDLGDRWELFPRFGVGTMARLNQEIAIRAELSHEFVVVGANFFF